MYSFRKSTPVNNVITTHEQQVIIIIINKKISWYYTIIMVIFIDRSSDDMIIFYTKSDVKMPCNYTCYIGTIIMLYLRWTWFGAQYNTKSRRRMIDRFVLESWIRVLLCGNMCRFIIIIPTSRCNHLSDSFHRLAIIFRFVSRIKYCHRFPPHVPNIPITFPSAIVLKYLNAVCVYTRDAVPKSWYIILLSSFIEFYNNSKTRFTEIL